MKRSILLFLMLIGISILAIAKISAQTNVVKAEAKADAIPVLSFFPQKFSAKDLVFISRKNNEAGVTKLSYTISAVGGYESKGDFEGSNTEFKAYINLAGILKNAVGLEKIHLLIVDNNGTKVTDADFQLVKLK